ncbi:hypothetical protein BCR44DRAFT_36736 [Catenaria anguillulae PL171]|uniref:Ankyrin repeat-containing domain protein n=1 Tax=Catenaria anguillulae PL171 TaxID=765915 RepID=A0A1Y2H9E1_9FUNG|nr:hypothetical protein BCR44DRAFT_36736 [Catenaria anguillulae PL171]
MSSLEPMKPCAFDTNDTAAAADCLDNKPTAATPSAAAEPVESSRTCVVPPVSPRPLDSASSSSSSYTDHNLKTNTPMLALSADPILPPSLAPMLTNELVELTIGFSLRLLPGKFYLPKDPAVCTLLNVLSRSVVPMPTKIALMLLPTVTLNSVASCAGDQIQLLNMMSQLSAAPYHRPMSYTSTLLQYAAEKGALAVQQWWLDHKDLVPLVCETDGVIYSALIFRQAHVLDWCVVQGFKIPRNDLSLVWGCNNVDILDWCVAHEVPLIDYENAMEDASEKGAVHVLAWWKASGLPLKYSHRALERAIKGRDSAAVLDWWANSGLKLYGDDMELTRIAIQHSDKYALEWLAKNNLFLVHSGLLVDLFSVQDAALIEWCMDRFKMQPSSLGLLADVWVAASTHVTSLTLDLAQQFGFKIPSISDVSPCLEAAARLGSVAVLDWWLWKFPTLCANHFESALKAATAAGHVPILDWIKQHGYFDQENDPDMASLALAAGSGHLDVLEWFAQHPRCTCGSPAHNAYSSTVFLAAAENGHVDILRWWLNAGMQIPSFADLASAGRQAFLNAGRNGHGAVLKYWVDAWMRHSGDNVSTFPPSLVRETLFHFLRSTKPDSIKHFKWWASMSGCLSYAGLDEVVSDASQLNRVDVLDWMLEAQLLDPDFRDYDGLDVAVRYGNVETMDWWVDKVDAFSVPVDIYDCFDGGVSDSDMHLVCHWLAHNAQKLSLDPIELPLYLVEIAGSAALFDRMLRLEVFTMPKSYSVYDEASAGGGLDVLTWWYATDLVEKKDKHYSKEALLHASTTSKVHVLDWWRAMSVDAPCTRLSGPLKLKFPFRSIDAMMARGDVAALAVEWWIASGLLPETAPEVESDPESGDEDDEEEGEDDEDEDEEEEAWDEDNQEDPMAVD